MYRWIKSIVGVLTSREIDVVEWTETPIYSIDSIGNQTWTVRGQYHRLNGPALITSDTQEWWVNGQRHRVEAAAVENVNGTRCWYFRGKRHRIDGPAMEFPWGRCYWYFHGIEIPCSNQKQFDRLLRLKAFW